MSVNHQEELFPIEGLQDIPKERRELMRTFIESELLGKPFVDDEDVECMVIVMAIAAEDLSCALAHARGELESEDFCSEVIVGKLNTVATGPLVFSVNEKFPDKNRVDEEVVEALLTQAAEIARETVDTVSLARLHAEAIL